MGRNRTCEPSIAWGCVGSPETLRCGTQEGPLERLGSRTPPPAGESAWPFYGHATQLSQSRLSP